MPLDETITAGQTGHIDDHETIATQLNLLGSGTDVAWTTYAPTLTNVTIGSGVRLARWCRVGRTIHVQVQFTLGAGSAITGTVEVAAPVAPNAGGESGQAVGSAVLFDNGTRAYAAQWFVGGLIVHTETGNSGFVNATSPFTWVSGDYFIVSASYEADVAA